MAWHSKFTTVQNGTTQQNSTRSASCVSQAVLLDMVYKRQRQTLTVLPCFSEEDSLHCPHSECCHTEGAVNPGSIIGPATCDKCSTSELTRQTQRLWVAARGVFFIMEVFVVLERGSKMATAMHEPCCNIPRVFASNSFSRCSQHDSLIPYVD
jgi:hypothetical protein